VITDITRDMRMFTEEVFGPVAGVYRADSINEAIELANATSDGLGANAWTDDPQEQQRLVDELDAGAVFINGDGHLIPAAAVRRRQELRLPTRAVRRRDPRILQPQVGLDRRQRPSRHRLGHGVGPSAST
jgi:aldehyde dehydrogenase family protein